MTAPVNAADRQALPKSLIIMAVFPSFPRSRRKVIPSHGLLYTEEYRGGNSVALFLRRLVRAWRERRECSSLCARAGLLICRSLKHLILRLAVAPVEWASPSTFRRQRAPFACGLKKAAYVPPIGRRIMSYRQWIGAFALCAALCLTVTDSRAWDDKLYPDLSGQWRPIGGPGRFDISKP